jgi:Na+/proline symporter
VAAIAFESVIKLLAFLAVGLFVVYGLFGGLADLFAQARAQPRLASLLRLEQGSSFAWTQWFALTLLSMLSVIFLPRQFQVMVVENVSETICAARSGFFRCICWPSTCLCCLLRWRGCCYLHLAA